MIIKKVLFIYFILLSCLFAKQNIVSNIRLSTKGNIERLVIESDNKINFNAFILKQPDRLVIDLQNTSKDIIAPNFRADKIIDTIRIGKFSELDTRLVFDLNIKSTVHNTFYLSPSKDNKKYRVIIDLKFNQKELENEDLIGMLIDQNNLYNVQPDVLNEIIGEILDDNNLNIAKSKESNKDSNSKKEIVLPKSLDSQEEKSANYTPNTPKTLGKLRIVSNKKTIVSVSKSDVEAYYSQMYDKNRKPRIVIDAGHGGKDPGAIGTRGTKEKILTVTYAKAIKEALEKTGKYKVLLTRNQDFFVELRERVSIARRFKGDLFISIHSDSSPNPKARGFSIYTLSQTASDTRTAQLAQKENKADIIGGLNLYGEYQDTINTLVDISRSKAMNDSKVIASILEKELLKRNVEPLGKMIKFGNFAVLTSADMPSMLLELGFLSNSTDERMIRSFGYETKVVNSIVATVDAYFK